MRTKKPSIFILLLCFPMLLALESCFFDPGENIYTKKLETIGEFFENDTIFEEFTKVLNKTGVMGMLKSYGEYTCFAPTNDAVRSFFADSRFGSLDNFPLDSLTNIVLYQLIENDAIQTVDFTSSRLRSNNMVNDQLQVRYDSLGDIVINGLARLLMWDMELRNGVVHLTDAIMLPDTATIDQKFDTEELQGRYTIFNRALKETGIAQLMHKTEDLTEFSYYHVNTGAKIIIPRYYKFTIFAESDSTYARLANIRSLDDLKQWCDDKGYGDPSLPIDDPQSSLYRYIAYHCLDRIYYKKDFENFARRDGFGDGYEVIETMYPNTLLEYRKAKGRIVFNPETRGDTIVENTGTFLTAETAFQDVKAGNGVIHELDGMMEIPDQTSFFHKKMRFNIASFLPELMNYGARGQKVLELPDARLGGPQYFENMIIYGDAGYVLPRYDYTGQWIRHHWDEILIGMGYQAENWAQCNSATEYANTRYDVHLRIPPVPPGTWEIRFGFTTNQYRGMAQLYFDGIPAGVPLSFLPTENYGISGMDEQTARKVLYNNGFMSFPTHITNANGDNTAYTRTDRMRRILGVFTFSKMEPHILRLKTVEPGQLSLNFVEYIPIEMIAEEGYD
jgi:uncharacterized surface protein with fasciclin (FAS1) repeats